jgi:hypothetical protein
MSSPFKGRHAISSIGISSLAGILLFGLVSCNFGAAPATQTPTLNPTATQTVDPSTPTFIVLTPENTVTSAQGIPTMTFAFTPFLSGTPQTGTPFPTASSTPAFTSTPSATPSPSPVTISVENTSEGDYLTINRSTDGLQYKIGPLASGVYTIGPNSNFFVYCTVGGEVFASKIGDGYLTPIGNVGKYFTAMIKGSQPRLEIVIFFNTNYYRADVRENDFNQNEIFLIPKNITGE